MKKKAFTLTELLVVVVIIGTLAAVVLPKFTKVLETRKTTEAEQLMAAVRNEQEARCTLDKNYTADTDKLASWPKNLGTNYNYELTASGISATSDKGYKLAIQSYRDGSICCSGDYCSKLGKSYPACSNEVVNTGCEASDLPDTPQPEEPCVPPAQTTQTDTRKCGCTSSGTKTGTRTFDMESCSWGDWSWGECTEQETDCTDECDESLNPGADTQACTPEGKGPEGCGVKTRYAECNESTGYDWKYVTSFDDVVCEPTDSCEDEECQPEYSAYSIVQHGEDEARGKATTRPDMCDSNWDTRKTRYQCPSNLTEKKTCTDIYVKEDKGMKGRFTSNDRSYTGSWTSWPCAGIDWVQMTQDYAYFSNVSINSWEWFNRQSSMTYDDFCQSLAKKGMTGNIGLYTCTRAGAGSPREYDYGNNYYAQPIGWCTIKRDISFYEGQVTCCAQE